MSEYLDIAIWWTGAGVLSAGAFLLAAGIIVGLHAIAYRISVDYARRIGLEIGAAADVRAWILAGRPKWRQTKTEAGKNVFVMEPTKEPT